MCGIFGVFFGKNINVQKLLKHAETLRHRGRDSQGHVTDQNTYLLAHLRHSVIDTTAGGHQPFVT